MVNPLDAKTIARIESGLLTQQEIEEYKNILQESINQGFKRWQIQNSRFSMSRPTLDNETLKSMLFAFLDQNPGYQEQFKLYDKLLSLEIEQKIENITRQVHESFKNINLIIKQRQLVREWNTTTTIKGENCTAINRVYEMEINGTTLTFVKVSIYSPNGVEIADPYGMLVANMLVYYTWFLWWPPGSWWPIWIFGPVVYGMDYLCYTRFPGEPSHEAEFYYASVMCVLYIEHADYVSVFSELASLAVDIYSIAPPYSTAVAVILASIAAAGCYITDQWYEDQWQAFQAIYSYNYVQDPSFGFEIMQRLHLVNSPQVWDPLSFTTLHYVNIDGIVVSMSRSNRGYVDNWYWSRSP
ncbi:MAG: hypothetical protein Q6366_017730 [Candidatus Freyarchaeota archaeon]